MAMASDFYLRYYVGHKGKFGHEFLEFEFRLSHPGAPISRTVSSSHTETPFASPSPPIVTTTMLSIYGNVTPLPPMSGIVQYLSCCAGLISLSVMSPSSIHAVAFA